VVIIGTNDDFYHYLPISYYPTPGVVFSITFPFIKISSEKVTLLAFWNYPVCSGSLFVQSGSKVLY